MPFCEEDMTPFSNGSVDVFFEKSFENKRNIVLMDGQGKLMSETISNCLCLSNMVLIQFNKADLDEDEERTQLNETLDMINRAQPRPTIVLLLRDAHRS